MRMGNDGCMWGKAVYFAQNASYSKNYSFKVEKSSKLKFFFAEILLGDIVTLAQDNSIKKPPINHKTGSNFDSIQGFTQGSDVFMVYANEKCYPRYLVTYEPRI